MHAGRAGAESLCGRAVCDVVAPPIRGSEHRRLARVKSDARCVLAMTMAARAESNRGRARIQHLARSDASIERGSAGVRILEGFSLLAEPAPCSG